MAAFGVSTMASSRSYHLMMAMISIVLLCPPSTTVVQGFSLSVVGVPNNYVQQFQQSNLYAKSSNSEFSVIDDDEDIAVSLPDASTTSDIVIPAKSQQQPSDDNNTSSGSSSSKQPGPEYGALSPGTVVQVQIGDLSLARKAWKKRRRTGSPLLVPCSVLNVDRQSLVRWNLIHLLEKFGHPQRDGISISAKDMAKHYRGFFRSSLLKQALALGFESTDEMLTELFNKRVEESYGVKLSQVHKNGEDVLTLRAPISLRKGHRRAAKAPMLQFRPHKDGDHGDADTLTHTGHIRVRNDDEESEQFYNFLPLSAALRVNQKDDMETGRIEQGSIHPAVVFDYDIAGDGGSPLLTLSLNPGGTREALRVKPDRKYIPIENPQKAFEDLKVGDGPFSATVVRLMYGKALVDCEIGRKVSSEGMVKVFGAIRYKDAVEVPTLASSSDEEESMEDYEDDFFDEDSGSLDQLFEFNDEEDDDDEDNDEQEDDGLSEAEELLALRDSSSFEEGTFEDGEIEEDITDMFEQNDDGTMSYKDPETGETITITFEDDDEDDDDLRSSAENTPSSTSRASRSDARSRYPATRTTNTKGFEKKSQSKKLRVGDELKVYIRSVSKQSGQYTVTLDPSVQGRKAKDLKQESEAQKRISRLEKKFGGDLDRILALEGTECEGTIRALSKAGAGDWVYVQPHLDDLPVGVASMTDMEDAQLAAGDKVRVVLNGIDEERGQLAMKVVARA